MEGAQLGAGIFSRTLRAKALPCIGLNTRRCLKDDKETARTMEGHSKLGDSPVGRLGGVVKSDLLKEQQESHVARAEEQGGGWAEVTFVKAPSHGPQL